MATAAEFFKKGGNGFETGGDEHERAFSCSFDYMVEAAEAYHVHMLELHADRALEAMEPAAQPSTQVWVRQESCSECDGDGCLKCEPSAVFMDDGIGGMGAGGSHYRPNADEPSAEQCGKLLETNGYQEFFCANKKPCPKHDESPAPASAREAQAMQKLRPLDDSIHAISELIVMGFVHRSDRKTPNEMIVEAEISIKQLFSTYATLAPQVAGPNYPQCPKCLGGVRLECDYAMYPTVECVGYCSAVEIESINDLIPFFRGAPPADQSVTASSGMLRYLGDVMKQPAGEVEIGGAPPAESREGQYILEHCENPPEPSEEVKARFARMGAPAEPQRWREVKVELPEEGSEVFAAVWWTTEETSHSSYEVHDCCFWKQGEEWGPKDIFVDCDGTEFDVEEVSFWIYRKDLVGHLPAPTPLPSPPKGERP